MQDNRRENHPRYSHQLLSKDHCYQHQPHGVFDPGANDFDVEEVFQLVNHHEKYEAEQRRPWRNCETDGNNQCVAYQVSDDWQQPAEKGDRDEHHGIWIAVAGQENCRQQRVDRRNDELRAHDSPETSEKSGELL